MFKTIDTFAILDQVTQTEGVSYGQVITWQLTILGTFVVVMATLFVYMNNRFDKIDASLGTATKERNNMAVSLGKVEAMLQMQLLQKGHLKNRHEHYCF